MEQGTCGSLVTLSPTSSPIIWTSVATGKTMDKHGITGFIYRTPDRPDEVNLFTNSDRKTKAVWNILTDYGRTASVIGWWMTFPVEPVSGLMVAQTNTVDQAETAYGQNIWKGSLRKGVPGQVYPPERQAEMIGVLEQCDGELASLTRQIFGALGNPQSPLLQRLWENCLWAFRADATYLRIAKRLAAGPERPELLAVYMGGTDVVGHRFWRYRYPNLYEHPPTSDEIEEYGHIIEDYYVYCDRSLGELLEVYGEEVTVIVCSDHGMFAINRDRRFDNDDVPAHVNSGGHPLAPPGVIIMAGPRIRRSDLPGPVASVSPRDMPLLCSIYDVAPTILALMDIPVGEDMDGRPVRTAIEPSWIRRHPIRTVATHDTDDWLAARPHVDRESPDKRMRLDQLRSLGYID
jgi:hypothetical protein